MAKMTEMKQLFNLDGRVAVVTGGAGLLGQAHCEILADLGAHVVVADFDRAAGERKARELTERAGVSCIAYPADIANPDEVQAMVDTTVDQWGRIDILVNNAFLTVRGGSGEFRDKYFAPFEEYDGEILRSAMNVNLWGTINVTQKVAQAMLKNKKGSIINVASVYGIVSPDQRIYAEAASHVPGARTFNTPVTYALCKSALINYTRYLATYWADKGIRVNTLTPHGTYEAQDENFLKAYTYRSPLGRMADRNEYKGAVALLASDASSYMTGANIVVDGGWTAW